MKNNKGIRGLISKLRKTDEHINGKKAISYNDMQELESAIEGTQKRIEKYLQSIERTGKIIQMTSRELETLMMVRNRKQMRLPKERVDELQDELVMLAGIVDDNTADRFEDFILNINEKIERERDELHTEGRKLQELFELREEFLSEDLSLNESKEVYSYER